MHDQDPFILESEVGEFLDNCNYTMIETICDLALELGDKLDTPEARATLAELDNDLGNIITALDTYNLLPGDELREVATTLYLQLWRYFDVRGLWDESRKWAWSLVPNENDTFRFDNVFVVNRLAQSYHRKAEFREAATLYEVGLKLAEQQSQPLSIRLTLANNLATALWQDGKLDEGLTYAYKSFESVFLTPPL